MLIYDDTEFDGEEKLTFINTPIKLKVEPPLKLDTAEQIQAQFDATADEAVDAKLTWYAVYQLLDDKNQFKLGADELYLKWELSDSTAYDGEHSLKQHGEALRQSVETALDTIPAPPPPAKGIFEQILEAKSDIHAKNQTLIREIAEREPDNAFLAKMLEGLKTKRRIGDFMKGLHLEHKKVCGTAPSPPPAKSILQQMLDIDGLTIFDENQQMIKEIEAVEPQNDFLLHMLSGLRKKRRIVEFLDNLRIEHRKVCSKPAPSSLPTLPPTPTVGADEISNKLSIDHNFIAAVSVALEGKVKIDEKDVASAVTKVLQDSKTFKQALSDLMSSSIATKLAYDSQFQADVAGEVNTAEVAQKVAESYLGKIAGMIAAHQPFVDNVANVLVEQHTDDLRGRTGTDGVDGRDGVVPKRWKIATFISLGWALIITLILLFSGGKKADVELSAESLNSITLSVVGTEKFKTAIEDELNSGEFSNLKEQLKKEVEAAEKARLATEEAEKRTLQLEEQLRTRLNALPQGEKQPVQLDSEQPQKKSWKERNK